MRQSRLQFLRRKHLPRDPLHSDLYLVEFPKSGITWISNIVSQLMISNEGDPHESSHPALSSTFLNDRIPDIHLSRNIGHTIADEWPGHRVIKSHCRGNPDYLKVIYIVRHPLAVMSSYYEYCSNLGMFSGTFSRFIRHRHFGIKAWNDHVLSWNDRTRDSQLVVLLRYESMRENPVSSLDEVLSAFGISPGQSRISSAVDLSGFEEMRQLEANRNKNHIHKAFQRFPGFRFVNKARRPEDVSISDEDRGFISAHASRTMAYLGYE